MQTSKISQATYNCDWYNLDSKQKKSFLLLLLHSQAAININAYGLLEMNYRTYGKV